MTNLTVLFVWPLSARGPSTRRWGGSCCLQTRRPRCVSMLCLNCRYYTFNKIIAFQLSKIKSFSYLLIIWPISWFEIVIIFEIIFFPDECQLIQPCWSTSCALAPFTERNMYYIFNSSISCLQEGWTKKPMQVLDQQNLHSYVSGFLD